MSRKGRHIFRSGDDGIVSSDHAKAAYLKVKLFRRDSYLYLDYVEYRETGSSGTVRLRPFPRKLREGWFVEMVEMEEQKEEVSDD